MSKLSGLGIQLDFYASEQLTAHTLINTANFTACSNSAQNPKRTNIWYLSYEIQYIKNETRLNFLLFNKFCESTVQYVFKVRIFIQFDLTSYNLTNLKIK